MSFDILAASNRITDKYIRYLKTMFDIDDPEYRKIFEQKMAAYGSFSKGPYLDVIDSFESGASVVSLIEEGLLNPDFKCVKDVYNKTLYKHQETSIRKLADGKNVVVSTGTGSGKTESFLIPILNSLMNERTVYGKITPGVRALLIYPMNALANDQISRLRSLLADYPYITFGAYTGQTENSKERALIKYKSLNNGKNPLKNELISREQMKDTPPNILITNYSMLEYLMLRPRDNSLFQGEYADKWKFIVLDEAHTYSGSTGIEVSMLLRRLKGYLSNSDIRFILTSATLGGEKTNNEVAQFARNLCNAPFEADDVIRKSIFKLQRCEQQDEITLTTADYSELNGIIESGYSDSKILSMLCAYLNIPSETEDYSEYLFDTLLKDKTFWRIKKFLTTPKTVKELCKAVEWTEKEVSDFVNVASKAVKNRKKLFDARYHMFVRATDGVFVTLGNHKDLSLTRMTTTLVDNVEYKFFEVVTCSQCHAMYLLGVIENENGLTYLKQKANLAVNNIREAFLVGDTVHDDDDDSQLADEHLKTENYELCPHCGFIRPVNQAHKTKCEHSENEYIKLINVRQSERTGRVTKCIKCEGTNNMGVLRSFFSGQEASTSVVGTALFEELPSTEIQRTELHITEPDDFDDGFDNDFGDALESTTVTNKAKQFIAFSDNRQAAAFFATYFYETYQGFLYSRIVNDNIKKIEGDGKPLVNFVRDMSSDFRNNKISEMDDKFPDYEKEAWKAIMKELIESYSRNSLTGLGLLAVDFNDNITIPENSKAHLTSDDVRNICLVWLRSMFEDNAIHHGQNFTEADMAFFTNNNVTSSYVCANPENKYIKSFVPKTDSTTNKRFDYLERLLEAKGVQTDREYLIKFMSALWKRLEKQEIFKPDRDNKGYRVDISKLQIKKNQKWYRCPKCHRITAYNVENVCPAYKCDGKLELVNIQDMEKDNHYYRIYNELDIQPLRVVEHTAQLNSEEAYRLQEKFKRQEIDVLSCSTTFEMGVDIGDLETVFMRNMPPTPSNYVQRAGRAGRSTKSAALALTFCNKSNHDFSFFNNPISMINGEIQPPLFKVENEKIGIRHLYSAAIASFWRENPEYFGRVKDMFGDEEPNQGYEDFKRYLMLKPAILKAYLLRSFPDELIDKFEIKTYGWLKWLFDEPNPTYPNLKNVYDQYRSEVDALYQEKEKLEGDNRSNYAVITRINTYTGENIITFLSRNNILPKYGFPVDTVELEISADKNSRVLPVELDRDLAMAISEYAPGCEIVAAGNLIKSRYIRKLPSKTWRLYDYVQCEQCKTLNVTLHLDTQGDQSIKECGHCKNPFNRNEIRTFLIPEFGFASEPKIGKPSLIKPDRTYRTEASMVSEGKQTFNKVCHIGGMQVQVTAVEDGEIALLNKSDFYVCPSCGYSLGDFEAQAFTPSIQREHRTSKGYKCKKTVLQRFSLGYRFKTDALHISINDQFTYEEAYSILQAIILSACNVLNLDNNEIAGCLQYVLTGQGASYDFIIYDTTPGGAGHVRRFSTEETIKKVLVGAYNKAKNCDCGGEEGDTSCYKCLRTYRNQQHHDIIKRRYVTDKLIRIFDKPLISQSSENILVSQHAEAPKKKIKLINMMYADSSISSERYDYIISQLDLESDVQKEQITHAMEIAGIRKPDYSVVDIEDESGSDIYADLVWEREKVLVFAPGNKDSFEAVKNSDYKCFLFDRTVDFNAFINALK